MSDKKLLQRLCSRLGIDYIRVLEGDTVLEEEKLFKLDLSLQAITDLKGADFSVFKHLVSLDLSRNNIQLFQSALPESLAELYLDNNRSLEVDPAMFIPLSSLLELRLEIHNDEFPLGIFASMHSLGILFLECSCALPDMAFAGLRNLRSLFIRNSRGLPEDLLLGLNLRTLGISGQRSLTDHIFDNQGNLVELHLTENKFSSLQTKLFAELGSLELLNLSNNGMKNLPKGIFTGMYQLGELDLSSNRLSSLPASLFDDLDNLHTLRIKDNLLESISYRNLTIML